MSSSDNLGQYKMEQLSPIPPKAMMKARRSKKRAILASLKWGEEWSRCSIYFVQDCSSQRSFSHVNHLRKVWQRCSHSIFFSLPGPKCCFVFSYNQNKIPLSCSSPGSSCSVRIERSLAKQLLPFFLNWQVNHLNIFPIALNGKANR